MRLTYDQTTDALFVRFTEDAIVESEEVSAGVVFDYDANGKIVAFEVLDARAKFAPAAIAALAAA